MTMYACAKRGRYHGTKLAQYRVSAPQLIFAILVLRKGGGGGHSDGTLRYKDESVWKLQKRIKQI